MAFEPFPYHRGPRAVRILTKPSLTNPMNSLRFTLTIVAAAGLLGTTPLLAQQKRVSPHETISKEIDGNRITVVYGRPYSKDPKSGEVRKIWGDLVPFGKVWRTGADESTLLVTQKPLTFGEITIPAGAYALFTLPEENGDAKLIISKEIGEWGAYSYDEKQDVARLDLKKGQTDAPLDEFTMSIDKGADGGGVLKMAWESTQYLAPFTVKK